MTISLSYGLDGNSNAKENMGILFSNYSTVMAIHKILITETKGNGLEADSVKAIKKIVNEVVASYRNGKELLKGLSTIKGRIGTVKQKPGWPEFNVDRNS